MRFILAILLLWAVRLTAATGDILGAYVETNGWVMHVKVEGLATNLAYNFGFRGYGSNNFVTPTQTCVLTLTSPGFNDTGASNRQARTIYGTTKYPFPYPDTNRFEIKDGSDVWLQVALSDYVFKDDLALTLNLRAGFYDSSLAVTGLSVTNLSTNNYLRVVANNSRHTAAFSLVTNSTHRVGVTAFHWSGQSGRPVRLVKFYATNSAGTAVTQIVTQASIDRSYGDAQLVTEYLWDVPLSTLGSSNTIWVNWTAYPWIGDTTSTTSTADGSTTKFVAARYSPLPFFNDRLSELHQTWANVDHTNGNDGTGIAIAASSWTTNTAPFRSIRRAAAAIAGTNNLLYGRNDCAGGIAWLAAGDHLWSGTNGTFGVRQDSWFTVTRQPLVPRSAVTITTNNSTSSPLQDINDVVRLKDITIGFSGITAGGSIFDGIDYLSVEDCDINTGQGAAFFNLTNYWFTRCTLINARQKWRAQSANVPSDPVFRGNWIVNTNGDSFESPLILGNYWSNNTTIQVINSTIKTSQVFTVWAHNKVFQSNVVASDSFDMERRENDIGWDGGAFIQNEVEVVTNPSVNGVMNMGSATTTTNIWNLLFFNNTLAGVKMNWFYNDELPTRIKLLNFASGNIIDDVNIKSDEFSPANGARIGNHAVQYSVGWYGNMFPETHLVGAAGTFFHRFKGLNGFGEENTNRPTYLRYTDRKAFTITSSTVGRGNYRLLSDSPSFQLKAPWILPFDFEGNPRSEIDPPGAYSAGNVRKGAFF